MVVTLICLGVISLGEVLLWFTPLWRVRKPMAALLIVALSIASGLLAGAHFSGWAILVLIFSLYRMVNLLRLVEGRTQADYLFTVAKQSSLWLIGLQLAILAAARLNHMYHIRLIVWLYALAVAQLLAAGILLASTLRHLRTTTAPAIKEHYADRDLPTVSVCVPARNETEDLEACLQSLIVSNYPKLEILVLDDCSQNKHTPEIIRAFAQDGVRFVGGKVPPASWLAKNYAYKQLVEEASGELLLFCGVDTRFQPESLRNIVETLLSKRKTMLSIIPRNKLPSAWDLSSLIIQPARYAWELSLPRRWLQRPPVLSTCWIITAGVLHAAGGFKAVNHNASPESYFARYSARHDDGYSFVQSSANVGLMSAKSFAEQRATAIRTRYPQTHRRPEIVGLLSLAELGVLILPFALAIGSAVAHAWFLLLISFVATVFVDLAYVKTTELTYRRFIWRATWLLPLAAFYDIGLLNYSMWRYEFREVIWKERNVCIPLMHAVQEKS
jgi:glycosyltransferase involved in cell wall biosynthesis